MINNNINFKGFKNVFCAFDVPVSNKSTTLLSMQLNDEGIQDLTEYKKLKNLQGDILKEKYGDTLTLTLINDYNNNSKHIFLDNKEMYWGDELRMLEDKFVPEVMSNEKYQLEKEVHMKAYTLLASLTERMKYTAFDGEDKERLKVIEDMYNTLCAILKKQEDAFRVTERACLKKVKFQDIARVFNKCIEQTMKRYFI